MRKLNMQKPEQRPENNHFIKPLKDLNLMDDFLFDVTTMDLEACKIILELSLGMRLKSLRWKEGQKVVHNLPGKRGIRLDFCAEDEEGNLFDVEMQKQKKGNLPKRTRFYQALLDAPLLKSGEESFDRLKPLYIVLICGFDLYGYKKYRYTFANYCEEIPGLKLGDECHKIVLNTKGENDDEVERTLIDFLHYVEQSSDERIPRDGDERLWELHRKIEHIKSSEEMEATYMKMEERERLLKEEAKEEGREEGRAEGREEGKAEIIKNMLRRNMPEEDICAITECSPEFVAGVRKKLQEQGKQ